MQVNAGVAYDYFFKEHTRYFFSWLKLSAKGARYWGRLSEPALRISKNISRVATLCQYGGDIPYAFQKFKEFASDQSPLLVRVCRVVNSAASIWDFSKRHILGQPCSILVEAIETVTDFVLSGYSLYNAWYAEEPERQVTYSWVTPKIALLVQKVSSFVLAGLALFSLYMGVNEYAPTLSIFLTTISLSSHFLYHYDQAVNKQKE
jgi:hypothetical protein